MIRFLLGLQLHFRCSYAGADPGFFSGGGALVSCFTSTPINHIVFSFCRIPVVLENRRSSQEGGGGAHPLHPPPRSAPVMEINAKVLNNLIPCETEWTKKRIY